MKKDTLMNKQVVKAISLALAAVMTATPMTALAEENVPNDDNMGGEQNVSDVANGAQDAVVVAKGAIDDAIASNNDANDANLNAANADLDNTNVMLDAAEANDGLATGEANKANAEAGKAEAAVDDAEKIVEDADKVVTEQMDKIQNANTIADANNAHGELKAAVEEAQADFDAKVVEYNTAKANAAEAAAKVAEYEAAYEKALADANANADLAAADLEAAKTKAAELEAAALKAKEEAESSAAYAVKKLEDENNGTNTNWKSEDKLFIAIMENYYVPEVLGYEGAKVTRIQGKDNNEYNYFLVKYTDNGEEKEAYYNYKLEGKTKDIVIFEKREVEVKGDPNVTPDQYRDEENNVVTKDNLEDGLKKGTFVEVNGTNYEKNDATDSETLVESSEITGTSTEDVTVSEDTNETYKIDETTGELVKEVTADVTTVTYTGKEFVSEEFDTEEARNTAADDKETELKEATGKDVAVTKTEETTYVSSGTYIPTFTATVEINRKVTVGNNDYPDISVAASEAEAKWDLYGAIADVDNFYSDYYVIENEKGDIITTTGNAELEEDGKYLDTYAVTATASVTYAKVSKKTITFNVVQGIIDIFTGDLEKYAKQWVAENGGIYLGSTWVNWDAKTADIRYVAAVKVDGSEADSEVKAEDSAQAALNASVAATTDEAFAGNSKVSVTVTAKDSAITTNSDTTYSYKVDYLEKVSENTVNQVVAKEIYAEAEKLTGEIIQNLNYKNKNFALEQYKDEDYRKFIKDAVDEVDAAKALLDAAEEANADVETAQKKVDELKAAIEALKNNNVSNLNVDDLNKKLADAESELTTAQEKLVEVVDKLADANEALANRVAALTPAPSVGGGSSTTVTPAPVMAAAEDVIVEELVEEPVTPVVPAVVDDEVEEEEETLVSIGDEEVPLASGTEEAEGQSIVEIEDEEVPLVAMPTEAEKANMSWWWLLIVALLGATGYKMYKDHQNKKEDVTK